MWINVCDSLNGVSTDLAVRGVLSQLVGAGKGGGDNVEVGEHHTLWLSQKGLPKSCKPAKKL